jgi:hypothetical protein
MNILENEWPIVFITKRTCCPHIFFLNNKDLRCKHPLRWNWRMKEDVPECIKIECPLHSISSRVTELGMDVKIVEGKK